VIALALPLADATDSTILPSFIIGIFSMAAVYLGTRPLVAYVRHKERYFERILQGNLLLDVPGRAATLASGVLLVALAAIGAMLTTSVVGLLIGAAFGAILPAMVLRMLKGRRLARLEDQLVGGIQTLASGVRAGLNLVQSLQMVARDGPIPLRQEFAHLVREYDYGVPLEEAMSNAAGRIDSGDFRLLFAALRTHRERGGDLGETLDRISESIREIQRLEKRIKTLTAQGRATARWLSAMPVVVLVILYFIDTPGTTMVLQSNTGKLLLLTIFLLNVLGYLWIKKIVSVDI
jgi:tight adherence protein B